MVVGGTYRTNHEKLVVGNGEDRSRIGGVVGPAHLSALGTGWSPWTLNPGLLSLSWQPRGNRMRMGASGPLRCAMG